MIRVLAFSATDVTHISFYLKVSYVFNGMSSHCYFVNVYIFLHTEEKIKAVPENDVDRTSEEGKASSVQFVHFNFSDEQIKKFKNPNTRVTISIDHNLYNHITKISEDAKNALMKDFN